MPELPEVETIRFGLSRKIMGLTLKNIQLLEPKSFQGDPDAIIGKKVINVWRRGKVLGIDLEGDLILLFHLKMSGQIILVGKEKFIGGHPNGEAGLEMPVKSTRVIFEFDEGSKLYFNDQRKFGWVKVLSKLQILEEKFLVNMGPEPLEDNFTLEIFKNQLQKRKKTSIKSAILDQTVLSGVGNIYACEALFLAKINPQKLVGSLTESEIFKLHLEVINVLNSGIKHGGSSRTHYVNSEGKRGYFLDYANVYNKLDNPCKVCSDKIVKITISGRGTYFCPSCQK